MAGPDSGDLLKFIICSRKKPGDTLDNYFYNWGIIHVALMVTSPVSMRVFKRYVQQYRVVEATSADTVFPLSPEEWDSLADHWLETVEDVKACISEEDYLERLRNHVFGDKAFQLLLTSGRVMWERDGFASGGVKLIQWLKRPADMPFDAFDKHWKDVYGPTVLEAFRQTGALRKYVQNPSLQLDPAIFVGTLFHHAGLGGYAGIEEFWFDDLDSMRAACRDVARATLIRDAAARFSGVDGAFSQVVMERVVFDFVSPGELSPRPGLDDPHGLERRILDQGYKNWHVPPKNTVRTTTP
jgi:hypothetical protein